MIALVTTALCLGCAGLVVQQQRASHYDYFVSPARGDAWTAKITGWQLRERADFIFAATSETSAVSDGGDLVAARAVPMGVAAPASSEQLRDKYFDFRVQRKRMLARDFASWIQTQAREHYFPDGPIDHWATLEETLEQNGDDCDGLELLTYQGLRDLGFDENEVFRAIVYRPSDGQHHMVTLWFEDPSDPWVIDPTGAMTAGMPQMSDLPGWVPLKLFSESTEYTVHESELPTKELPPMQPHALVVN